MAVPVRHHQFYFSFLPNKISNTTEGSFLDVNFTSPNFLFCCPLLRSQIRLLCKWEIFVHIGNFLGLRN